MSSCKTQSKCSSSLPKFQGKEHRKKKKKKNRGRDSINSGVWHVYLWVTGARDQYFRAGLIGQENVPDTLTQTQRTLCQTAGRISTAVTYLMSFPMEEQVNYYYLLGRKQKVQWIFIILHWLQQRWHTRKLLRCYILKNVYCSSLIVVGIRIYCDLRAVL